MDYQSDFEVYDNIPNQEENISNKYFGIIGLIEVENRGALKKIRESALKVMDEKVKAYRESRSLLDKVRRCNPADIWINT